MGLFTLEHLKLLAAIFDQGLGCGLFSIDDVIRWSDNVIEVLEKPPYAFIQLSMMSSAKIGEVEDKLLEFYGNIDIDTEFVLNMLLGVICQEWSNKGLSIQEAVRSMVQLLVHTNFFYEHKYYNLYRAKAAPSLARTKIILVFLTFVKYCALISKFELHYRVCAKKLAFGAC